MNRTIKDATVKRYFYETHDQLRNHLRDFVDAYNFARSLKTLRGLTPYEFICKAWTSDPQRFKNSPLQKMPGLNMRPLVCLLCFGQLAEPTCAVSADYQYQGSRPKGLHLQPLAERCVSLSTHTAPIRQTRRYCFDANVRTVCAACWQWTQSFGQPVFSVLHSACTYALPTRSMWR